MRRRFVSSAVRALGALATVVAVGISLGAGVVVAAPAPSAVQPSAAVPGVAGPSAAQPSAAVPSAAGPSAAEPSAAVPSVAGPSAAGPSAVDAAASAPVVSDGPVAVTTRLSPDPSNIGDVLVLEVVAAFPRDVRVNLPTRLSFEPLHHVRTEEGEPEPTGDGLRKTFRIELQHFAVGPATIPGFPLTYVDADGNVRTVDVPPRPFVVESLLANETDPPRRGEDPPISREYPDTLTETVIWSALATLVLVLVGWIVGRRLWGRERPVVLPPPIPAHEVAIEALDHLERGELLVHGEVQRYYVELTEIAKGYIEGRFGVDALDRTTDEIRQGLIQDGARLAPLSPDDVIAFLQHCDLVKFARLAPPDEEARGALGTVREMVHESIPSDREAQAVPAPAADDDDAVEPARDVAETEVGMAEPAKGVSEPEAGMAEMAEPEVMAGEKMTPATDCPDEAATAGAAGTATAPPTEATETPDTAVESPAEDDKGGP